ncbi:hypothetical protein OOC_11001 [Providencia rettgeri Dmel1]|nr:hypothetical protein OOC_11001 [Providencia rettgeri Dmel1]
MTEYYGNLKQDGFMIISFIPHLALAQVLICHYRLSAIFITETLQIILRLKWSIYGIKMLIMILFQK